MSSIVKRVIDKKMAPEKFEAFIPTNIIYETIMGSFAYGCSTDDSDVDVYCVVIPPKDYIFPHTAGYIYGFNQQVPTFRNTPVHHIWDEEKGKEYDLNIFSIINYFNLCMDCNPNMIDSLFAPQRCITQITTIGQLIRDNRKIFLHKGAKHRYLGYSFAQMKKIRDKNPEGKRKELVDKFGYDVKYAMHLVRLIGYAEQILMEGDLDLERDNERLKAIRRGDWALSQVEEYFNMKESQLEELYHTSTIQHSPDVDRIKQLLLQCLESHYGSLDKLIRLDDKTANIISEIDCILQKYR